MERELKGASAIQVTTPSGTPVPDDQVFADFVSPSVRPLERIIFEIAPTNIPVLIIGESGSGKEVIAQRVHRFSRRANEPFVKVTCAHLSQKDLDQFLEGNNGAGIVKRLWEAGTVFLDEVGDLEAGCQPKLLHVLPDDDAAPLDCYLRARVISSTSRDIEEEIRNGRFREDLYYRLNGVCLQLPPLRRRKEDIPVLIDFFLRKYSGQFGRPQPTFSANAMSKFLDFHWPGNIRQLENAVRNMVALGDERLALGVLGSVGAELGTRGQAIPRFSLKQAARAASHHAERELILQTLQRTRWNRKRAAQELQISYKALLYKLKEIGMEDKSESSISKGQDL